MNTRLARTLRFTALLSLTVACATHESGPRFPVESGLEGTRLLQMLSPIEAAALCLAEGEGAVRFLASDVSAEYLCTLQAAFDAMPMDTGTWQPLDVGQCEAKRMECLHGPPKATATFKCQSSSIPSPCLVSVRDVETCSERYLETIADEWQAVSCASLAEQLHVSIPVQTRSPSDLSGCEHLKTDCPGRDWITISVTRESSSGVTFLDRRLSVVSAPSSSLQSR